MRGAGKSDWPRITVRNGRWFRCRIIWPHYGMGKARARRETRRPKRLRRRGRRTKLDLRVTALRRWSVRHWASRPKLLRPHQRLIKRLGVNFRCAACRHLTAREKQELMATAYSEDVNGSAEEYKALISTMLNRANSGDPQFGGGRAPRNVHDVIHARRQFGGVPSPQQEQLYMQQRRRTGKKIAGSPYLQFMSGDIDERANKDLKQALESVLTDDYPTTGATAYIVRKGGAAPTAADLKALGTIISGPEKIGNAHFYRLSPTRVSPTKPGRVKSRR